MRAHTHAPRSAVSHLTQRWEGEGLGGVRAGDVSASVSLRDDWIYSISQWEGQ